MTQFDTHEDAADPEGGEPAADDGRARDRASIERLAETLIPALIAKLSATALGEIEVREGGWKIRLRRPSDALGPMYGRRSTDRQSRAQPGHAGHGHAPAAVEPHRSGHDSHEAAAGPAGSGSTRSDEVGLSAHSAAGGGADGSHHELTAVGPGPDPGARLGRMGHLPEGDEFPAASDSVLDAAAYRAVATSPAVGIFQARRDLATGTRVRAGDRLASVDMLGVPQPVLAPVDGLVGATLVENGDPVEYGQELVRIELPGPDARGDGDGREPHEVAPGGPGDGAHGEGGSSVAGSGSSSGSATSTEPRIGAPAGPPDESVSAGVRGRDA